MKYFKHDLLSRDDDKIFELIEIHGMVGYGLWWALLEELYKAEENGFQIDASETWFKRLSKTLNLTDWRSLIRVLDTMAAQGLISSQLWAEHVIYAPGIAKRADQYVKAKELAAERKREQRRREKEAMSRVTDVGQPQSHNPVTTNTDPDSYSNSETNSNSNPKESKREAIASPPHPSGLDVEKVSPEPEQATADYRPVVNVEVVSTGTETEKDHGSANLPKNKKPTKAEIKAEYYDTFRNVWNDRKPPLFVGMDKMTVKRSQVFDKLVEDAGGVDEAIAVFENALSFACTQSWYNTKDLTFEQLQSNGKIFQLHEKWLARQASGGKRNYSEKDHDLLSDYERTLKALGV